MSIKPILFSGPMVQAILAGRKTMTRRVIKPQPLFFTGRRYVFADDGCPKKWEDCEDFEATARYQPGDILWVRETHYRYGHWMENGFSETGKQKWTFKPTTDEVRFFDDAPDVLGKWSAKTILGWWKRPAIYMPFSATRIWLLDTATRVERLQKITEADAKSEGIDDDQAYERNGWFPTFSDPDSGGIPNYIGAFCELWNHLNALRGYGWDTNPWVWVYSLEPCEKPT